MEPTSTQDSTTPSDGEAVEVKKVETQNPATEIVINSEDGTISKPSDASQDTTPVSSESTAEPIQATTPVGMEQAEAQPTTDSSPVSESLSPEAASQAPDESSMPQAENTPLAAPQPQQKKSKGPVAAIVAAILIALLLAGVGVAAYMKMKKPVTKNSTAQPVATTPETKKTITADDVNTTIKDIETEANKTTGDADMPTTDSVTDKSLGL